MRVAVFVAAMLLLAGQGSAHADEINLEDIVLTPDDIIDPPLHIGTGIGTACAMGCGGHPNAVSATRFSVYTSTPGGAAVPWLVILGLPDYTGPAPTIREITGITSFQLGGKNAYGGSWDPTTGMAVRNQGKFTPTETRDVYSFIGLPGGNNSENHDNWFSDAAAQALGYMPDFFGIYVYRIDGPLRDHEVMDVIWNEPGLPVGTYALGYGVAPVKQTGRAKTQYQVYSTAYTESGQVTSVVPEPGSLSLLMSGVVGLGLLAWKRKGFTRRLNTRVERGFAVDRRRR